MADDWNDWRGALIGVLIGLIFGWGPVVLVLWSQFRAINREVLKRDLERRAYQAAFARE